VRGPTLANRPQPAIARRARGHDVTDTPDGIERFDE
jgi:hypothetical protein